MFLLNKWHVLSEKLRKKKKRNKIVTGGIRTHAAGIPWPTRYLLGQRGSLWDRPTGLFCASDVVYYGTYNIYILWYDICDGCRETLFTCLRLQRECVIKYSNTRDFCHLSLRVPFTTTITLAVNNNDGSN